MLTIRTVNFLRDWRKIKKLYVAAFPADERKPLWLIRQKYRTKEADIWVIETGKDFVGFATTQNQFDMILLDYFAISEEKRNQGYGGKALHLFQETYKDKRFFLEIECEDETAPNAYERTKRKQFYLSNQMTEIGVKAKVFGVDMELLGFECAVTFKEYKNLYYASYGDRIIPNIIEL